MWLEDPSLLEKIGEWWSTFEVEGRASYVWWKKVKLLKDELKVWNVEVFGRIDLQIKKKLTEMSVIELKEEQGTVNEEDRVLKVELKSELDILVRMEAEGRSSMEA
ncbi:hypothetical protein FRX31_008430 [Thalictrum thalictroides]|uniref:Uncharacterized protein n=1 Tax=Thalictrum thalictroides TaxID=46969 RepID=A0A7J6WX13_THATH|nr:hypothetical protein FRX31_008430 [Thalictrum thalictroides]